MTIALIVKADEPALFFTSIPNAENYLEAIDVEDGVYPEAYGPNGEPFHLGVKRGRVVITPIDQQPQPEKLRALLDNYFRQTAQNVPPGESLPAQLARCEGSTVA